MMEVSEPVRPRARLGTGQGHNELDALRLPIRTQRAQRNVTSIHAPFRSRVISARSPSSAARVRQGALGGHLSGIRKERVVPLTTGVLALAG
jgi:hypothetical protein